jgi:DnaJ-domain-containing protein 1
MSDQLVLQISPEEKELQNKNAELYALEVELIQGELDLATTHTLLQNFEREYQQVIGTRYTELEQIENQISEYMMYLETNHDFKPSEDIKKIYRQVAKLIHPDLTTDLIEKTVRQQLMAEANEAYEEGNIEKLRSILHSWKNREKEIQGEGVGAKLIRIIRKIAQCRERLKNIHQEIEDIERTELYQLQLEVSAAKINGKNILVEIARDLDRQINEAQKDLIRIKEKLEVK